MNHANQQRIIQTILLATCSVMKLSSATMTSDSLCNNTEKLEPNNWWAIVIDNGRPFRDVVVERNTIHDWPQREDKRLKGSGSELKVSDNLVYESVDHYRDASRRIVHYTRQAVGLDSLSQFHRLATGQAKGFWDAALTPKTIAEFFRNGFEPDR